MELLILNVVHPRAHPQRFIPLITFGGLLNRWEGEGVLTHRTPLDLPGESQIVVNMTRSLSVRPNIKQLYHLNKLPSNTSASCFICYRVGGFSNKGLSGSPS